MIILPCQQVPHQDYITCARYCRGHAKRCRDHPGCHASHRAPGPATTAQGTVHIPVAGYKRPSIMEFGAVTYVTRAVRPRCVFLADMESSSDALQILVAQMQLSAQTGHSEMLMQSVVGCLASC